MTIALGFRYDNGVLLCADTELSGWANTTHARKIFHTVCRWGSVAFAYSGNSDFAVATIQRCLQGADVENLGEAHAAIERILDRQYRKQVLSHPQSQDPNLHYSLIFALCTQHDASLYMTYQTSVHSVDSDYASTGIGEALAKYIIGPCLQQPIGERHVLLLGTFTLGCIKGNVPGCGGPSQFVFLRRGYEPVELWSMAATGAPTMTNTEWLERHSKGCDALAHRLWLNLANPDISDADFEKEADEFRKLLSSLRADWRKRCHAHESFAELLPGGPKLLNIEDELTRPSPKHDPSDQPPPPESPGGPGES